MQGSSGDTDIENRLMELVGWGEEEEGGMYGESNMETYIIECKIDSGNLLYDSGNSNLGSVTILRGGMRREVGGRFKREGTYVYLRLIHVDVWRKATQYYKASFNEKCQSVVKKTPQFIILLVFYNFRSLKSKISPTGLMPRCWHC